MPTHLILGGARSGKSRHAEQLAAASGLAVHVIVTAEALDDEMAARIARHQADRPAGWAVHEAPRNLATTLAAVAAPDRCVWASDWPHPVSKKQPPNDADLLELLYRYVRSEDELRRILVDNPSVLFGYGSAA